MMWNLVMCMTTVKILKAFELLKMMWNLVMCMTMVKILKAFELLKTCHC